MGFTVAQTLVERRERSDERAERGSSFGGGFAFAEAAVVARVERGSVFFRRERRFRFIVDSSALKTCLRRSFKFCERINASRLLLKTRRNLRKREGSVDTTGAGNARDGATFFFDCYFAIFLSFFARPAFENRRLVIG